MNDYSYSIYSDWLNDRTPPSEIAVKFLETLDRLGRVDPVFRGWVFVPWQPDDPDLPDAATPEPTPDNIEELVLGNVTRDDSEKPDPDAGYGPLAVTQSRDRSRKMVLSVTAGSRWVNEANLDTGGYKAPLANDLVRYPLFRQALQVILDVWKPSWARVQGFKSEQVHIPRGALTEIATKSEHRTTWMAYLSDDLAKGLTLPAGLHTEFTPEGGLLMVAARDRLDPDNAEHMRYSDFLTTMMAKRRPEPPRITPPATPQPG